MLNQLSDTNMACYQKYILPDWVILSKSITNRSIKFFILKRYYTVCCAFNLVFLYIGVLSTFSFKNNFNWALYCF